MNLFDFFYLLKNNGINAEIFYSNDAIILISNGHAVTKQSYQTL
jgi:hypothetical protein